MATKNSDPEPETRPLMADTSGFQRDLLRALDDIAPCSGADVRRWMSALYDKEVNHGRLYPNLDSLEAEGLIEKRVREDNDRDKEFRMTADGEQLLEDLR